MTQRVDTGSGCAAGLACDAKLGRGAEPAAGSLSASQIDVWERELGVPVSAFEALWGGRDVQDAAADLGRWKSLGALLAGVTAWSAAELARLSGLQHAAFEPSTLAAAFDTIVPLDPGSRTLRGNLRDVVNVQHSRSVLVRVGESRLARIDLTAPGVSIIGAPDVGCHAAGLGHLSFERVELMSHELGQVSAADLVDLDRKRRVFVARALCAWARELLDDTIGFLSSRRFGAGSLIDQQVTRHRLADLIGSQMLVEAQLARAEHDRSLLFVAEVMSSVLPELVKECQQLHGGRGFLVEYWVSRAYRDSLCLSLLLGPSDELRARIAQQLSPSWRFED